MKNYIATYKNTSVIVKADTFKDAADLSFKHFKCANDKERMSVKIVKPITIAQKSDKDEKVVYI